MPTVSSWDLDADEEAERQHGAADESIDAAPDLYRRPQG
jgi:hypothetical protein